MQLLFIIIKARLRSQEMPLVSLLKIHKIVKRPDILNGEHSSSLFFPDHGLGNVFLSRALKKEIFFSWLLK
jgi:hypothetical protein